MNTNARREEFENALKREIREIGPYGIPNTEESQEAVKSQITRHLLKVSEKESDFTVEVKPVADSVLATITTSSPEIIALLRRIDT